ncbi:MAG: hypothetical protein M1561_01530 [Gammaproteobacteria bacterium]|nr:hypothetical protein [Gammaproteobacteria bacterium]
MSDIGGAVSTSLCTIHIPELECEELTSLHGKLENFAHAVDDVAMNNKVVNLRNTMQDFFQMIEDTNLELKMATSPKAVEEILRYHGCLLITLIVARNTNPEDSQQIEAQQIDLFSNVYDNVQQEQSKAAHELSRVAAKYEAKDGQESKAPPSVIQVQPQGSHLLETWRRFYGILSTNLKDTMPNSLSSFKTTLDAVDVSKLIEVKVASNSSCSCVML